MEGKSLVDQSYLINQANKNQFSVFKKGGKAKSVDYYDSYEALNSVLKANTEDYVKLLLQKYKK